MWDRAPAPSTCKAPALTEGWQLLWWPHCDTCPTHSPAHAMPAGSPAAPTGCHGSGRTAWRAPVAPCPWGTAACAQVCAAWLSQRARRPPRKPYPILGLSSGIAPTSKLVEKRRGRTWFFIKTRLSGSLCWRFMGKVRKSTETLGKPEFGVIMKCETQALSCGLGFLLQNILCSSFRRERAGRAQNNAAAGARDSHTPRHRSGWQMINFHWEPSR